MKWLLSFLSSKRRSLPAIEAVHLRAEFASYSKGAVPGPGGPEFEAAIPIWNAGNYKEAYSRFERAISLGLEGPDYAHVLGMMGTVKLMHGNIHEGVQFMLRALAAPQRAADTACTCSLYLAPIYDESGDRIAAVSLAKLAKQTNKGIQLEASTEQRLRELTRKKVILGGSSANQ